jgi:hypothetical protein
VDLTGLMSNKLQGLPEDSTHAKVADYIAGLGAGHRPILPSGTQRRHVRRILCRGRLDRISGAAVSSDLREFLAAFPIESPEWPSILASLKTTFGNTAVESKSLIEAVSTYFRL